MNETQIKRVALFLPLGMDLGREIANGVLDFSRENAHWTVVLVRPPGNLTDLSPTRDRFEGIIGFFSAGMDFRTLKGVAPHMVGVSNAGFDSPVPRVINDDPRAGELVAEYFLKRGFRHFCYAGYDAFRYACERGEGFRARLREENLEATLVDLHSIDLSKGHGETRDLLLSLPRPMAVFVENDHMAVKLLRRAHDAGLQIPGDLAFMGVDNERISCAMSVVPLSSVALAGHALGVAAARKLDALMNGRDDGVREERVPPLGIVSRASSDTLAVSDPLLKRVFAYVREHMHLEIGVEDMAGAVKASRRTLERRFMGEQGLTPFEALNMMRVRRAEELLQNPSLSVEEVAMRTGFSDARTLRVHFKKHTGKTPTSYRQSLLGHFPSADGQ
ncbi:MAG: substrate-binding domain-containing protein [Verrucomicrobia bacterium]|nr:substrate-binding domain-containing protein [Verrucomicrobiota bacterium]MCH8510715.1 substrate-binding domain-containing protein [Kiritimatiellia bacterium]